MKEESGSYVLLLGQGFLRHCGGTTNWATKQPTFTYGPKSNSTMVRIQAKGLEYSDDSPSKQVKPTHSTRVEVMDLTPIKCIGLGKWIPLLLYQWCLP